MSPVHRTVVSVRRVFARRPWLYWLAVTALALGVAAIVHDEIQRTERIRDSWGVMRPVLIATDPITPGAPLSVDVSEVPAAVVPDGALDATSAEASGAVARQRIGIGEIVTDADVARGRGPMALVPDGWLVVPVVESAASGATTGDRVRPVSEGVVLSTDAIVIGRVDESHLVAVPADDAALLAGAAAADTITLLRIP